MKNAADPAITMGVRPALWGALLVAVLGSSSGCGEDATCGVEPSEGAAAPRISEVELLGQLQDDPWTAILGIGFNDSSGDLGRGNLRFYLNGGPSGEPMSLVDTFRQTGVPLDATSGEIGLPLRFGETVSDGARVWLGLQMRDVANNYSNCYAIELHFDVQ